MEGITSASRHRFHRAAQVDDLPHFRDHTLAVGQLDAQQLAVPPLDCVRHSPPILATHGGLGARVPLHPRLCEGREILAPSLPLAPVSVASICAHSALVTTAASVQNSTAPQPACER